MLRKVRGKLSAIGFSIVLFLSSLLSPTSKVYAAQKRQTQQQQQTQIQQVRIYGIDPQEYLNYYEIEAIYEYLNLNKRVEEYKNKGLDIKEISNKRNSLEEKIEKILERQAKSVFNEMYPEDRKSVV